MSITGRRHQATRNGESATAMCSHCDETPEGNGGIGTNAVRVKRWARDHARQAHHRTILRVTGTKYYNGQSR